MLKRLVSALPTLFVLVTAGAQSSVPRHPMVPAVKHKLVVIAHRGDHTALPENTLAAYQSAIDKGVDFVEVDLRTTRDSGLVIMHNESVDRMTHGKGNIRDLTYDSIRTLKITDPATGKTYQIPNFQEVLDLCKGKVNIYLDFKEADPGTVYKLIRKAGMQKHVVVYANTLAQLAEWGRVAPDMPVMTSLPDEIKDTTQLATTLDKYRVAAVDGGVNQYTADMLALLKQRKVAVWLDVQTRDEGPAIWSKALALGIDGMQSDHPGALVDWLIQQEKR